MQQASPLNPLTLSARVPAHVQALRPDMRFHQHPNGGGWVVEDASVHSTAHIAAGAIVFGMYASVNAGAKVGERCRIGRGAQVRENVKLGKGCILDEYASVGRGCVLGNHVTMGANAAAYESTHVLDDATVGRRARVGARSVIGEQSVITEGTTFPEASTPISVRVGSYNLSHSGPKTVTIGCQTHWIKDWLGTKGRTIKAQHPEVTPAQWRTMKALIRLIAKEKQPTSRKGKVSK